MAPERGGGAAGVRLLDRYAVVSENVPAEITIAERLEEYVNTYELKQVKLLKATEVVMNYLKEKIISSVNIKISEILDPREIESVRKKFIARAEELVTAEMGGIGEEEKKILVGKLVQDLLGLGDVELLLADNQLEEIVINSAREPVWVYHKKWGWLKTDLVIKSEEQIQNYAAIIGRKVGRQITNLNPLMDAHLTTGDRVNAVLFPISSRGNCITIRKFAKSPWTIVRMMEKDINTVNAEIAALLWLGVQYEMNILISGGTGSGKTSFLNAILVFTPPNQRIISIEDTRELYLPEYLNWTPLVTRQPNPEGRGEVSMLDLMVNSLRMRPDRIVLGEMRRQREAEVLFEAMHTGHAVYATVHADDAMQTKKRLTSPPIALPESMLEALHLIVVQYRQRRTGIRRVFELAEIVPTMEGVGINKVFKWMAREDEMRKVGEYVRLLDQFQLYTGMTESEIKDDLADKKKVLNYMLGKKIYDVDDVGKVVAFYYRRGEDLMKAIDKKTDPKKILEKGA